MKAKNKIVLTLLFIVLTVSMHAGLILLLPIFLLAELLLIIHSRISFKLVLKRLALMIPFILFALLANLLRPGGSAVFALISLKAFVAGLALILLSTTTSFDKILLGLRELRVPYIMVEVLSFLLRYLSVIESELGRMKRARDSRSFGKLGLIEWIKTSGGILGSLFIRSYERSERVYQAMLARGYGGSQE